MKEKQCTDCKECYPETDEYFYTQKQNDGSRKLRALCKHCDRKRSNNYRIKHKEERARYSKKWIKKDDNRKTVNERAREWRKNNTEWKQEYQLQYQRENKDKINQYGQHRIHEITNEEWENCLKYFNYSCAYCGIHQDDAKQKYDNYLHKEHVVHDGDNSLNNCVPACKSCNSRKWQHNLLDWYSINNPRYKKERLDKIMNWTNKDYSEFLE